MQCSDHVALQSHVANKNHISTTRMPMATNFGRTVAYFERLLTIKSFITLITWSCKVTWQTKIIVYPQPYPQLYIHAYGYKIGSILIYLHVFLPLKSHHPLITWPCKITWPTKIIISPLPQCQWPPNLLRWWYTLTDS